MELPELLGRIEYFLVHQDGLTSEQINALPQRLDYANVLLPHINDVFAKIKNGQQVVDSLEQNKMLLLGGSNA